MCSCVRGECGLASLLDRVASFSHYKLYLLTFCSSESCFCEIPTNVPAHTNTLLTFSSSFARYVTTIHQHNHRHRPILSPRLFPGHRRRRRPRRREQTLPGRAGLRIREIRGRWGGRQARRHAAAAVLPRIVGRRPPVALLWRRRRDVQPCARVGIHVHIGVVRVDAARGDGKGKRRV